MKRFLPLITWFKSVYYLCHLSFFIYLFFKQKKTCFGLNFECDFERDKKKKRVENEKGCFYTESEDPGT